VSIICRKEKPTKEIGEKTERQEAAAQEIFIHPTGGVFRENKFKSHIIKYE
jgi:hypothetical protein